MNHPPAPSADGQKPCRPLAPLLRQAWYNLNQAFRRRIASSGLTPDQFTVLRWLKENPPGLTQRQLAGLMSSDANTVTSLLARMEGAGLVLRRRDPHDRRRQNISLTDKGRRLHARLQPIASEVQRDLLAVIPASGRERFLAQLDLIAHACQRIAARNRARSISPAADAVRRGRAPRR